MNNLQRWNDIIEGIYNKLIDDEVFFDIDGKVAFNYGYLLALRKTGAISAKEFTILKKVHANFDNYNYRYAIKDGSLVDNIKMEK